MMDGGGGLDKRRSFVHHRLQQAGAAFADIGGGVVAAASLSRAGGDDENAAARHLALADLSPLPRIGYKGKGAPDWLREQGVNLPARPNLAQPQPCGALALALSQDEHLILAPIKPPPPDSAAAAAAPLCARLTAAWSLDSAARCYQLPRFDSHCRFALCGKHAADVLAKLCGVDLRAQSFAENAIAQTSIARISAIVLRRRLAQTAAYDLLADNAAAEYLWDCLLDAMNEFNGQIVGINALRALEG